MAFSPSSSFSPIVFLLFLLLLTITVESRPSPPKDNKQVLDSLFGPHLSSLLSASSTFNKDLTEGSADNTGPSSSAKLPQEQGVADRRGAVPRFFLDFLRRQTKTRRRSRKSMVGGRGCFGMKMDRIGSVSGLGC